MALDSFRQLITDAQAMMDPDFAGKLSADIGSEDADTDFSFGAAEPSVEAQQEVTDSLEEATDKGTVLEELASDFNFGANESQIPLLDPSHFSPFEERPARPFLKMPKQKDQAPQASTRVPHLSPLSKNRVPQVSQERPGDGDFGPEQISVLKIKNHFMQTRRSRHPPYELIRFLIDRSGYIKALESRSLSRSLQAALKTSRNSPTPHTMPRSAVKRSPTSSIMPRSPQTPTSSTPMPASP